MVVVHGIGRQRKGETLAEVAEALALTLEKTASADFVIQREMDITGPAATATLRIGDSRGDFAIWTLKEALWADAFTAPPARAVLLWMARAIPRQARYLLTLLRQSPSGSARVLSSGPVHPGTRLWSEYIASWYTWLQIVLLAVLLLVVSPFLTVTGLALVYLQRVPLKFIHPFDPFLSRVLGDVYRYTTHGMWAASARGVVERLMIDFIEDETDPIEDLTVVAHSMGCVVAYDALRGSGAVAEAVKRSETRGRRKKFTFVAIGSGINQVFAVARLSETYGKAHFCQPLDPAITGPSVDGKTGKDLFEWVDIYARMDLVPAGGLAPAIRTQSGATPEQYEEFRVRNTDIPFRDHSSYFENQTVVMPRVIRAINGGEEYRPVSGVTAAAPTEPVAVDSRPRHSHSRRQQAFNAAFRALLPIALFGAAVGTWLGTSSPEDGFVDSFGNGPWELEIVLVLAAMWIGRLLTAALMVLATVIVVGAWIRLSDVLFDGVWVWVAAAGPWAVELAAVYVTILATLFQRWRRDDAPGAAA